MKRITTALMGTLTLALCALPSAARADSTLTVNTTADTVSSGSCSLRGAVAFVNATSGTPVVAGTNGCAPAGGFPSGTTTVNVPASATHYVLSSGALTISSANPAVINGAGATATVVDANGSATTATSRVFTIGPNANVALSGLTVTGGNPGVETPASGAAVRRGIDGGGILNQGTLQLKSVTVSGNFTSTGQLCTTPPCSSGTPGQGGDGAGVFNDGGATLTITGSTITQNRTGGAVKASSGSAGAASGAGGGILNLGTLNLSSSTIAQNTTGDGGDGGDGAPGSSGGATASPGGTGGTGGRGGPAGVGGGIADVGAPFFSSGPIDAAGDAPHPAASGGVLQVTGSAIASNALGTPGTGGAGGVGGVGGTDFGLLISGPGGPGGQGGQGGDGTSFALNGQFDGGAGIFFDAQTQHATVTATTISGNHTSPGGAGGAGGAGGTGGVFNPAAVGAGALGGAGGSSASGGGVEVYYGTVNLTNATIAANTTAVGGPIGVAAAGATGTSPSPGQPGNGAGVDIVPTNTLANLLYVTLANNGAQGVGGGFFLQDAGNLQIANSIVAANTAANSGNPPAPATQPIANCGQENTRGGILTDQGYNLFGGNTSGCPSGTGSMAVGSAGLVSAGIADNGGPLQTIALTPGSKAVDLVPATSCQLPTDERGVPRPQGPRCDAGAYELSPPGVLQVAAVPGSTTTARITANVTPNINPGGASANVHYGTTPAYGSTTPPQSLAAGPAAVPFSAALAGLAPGTTYHYAVVATNSDGTTQTPDATFTTPPAVSASLTSVSTTGPVATVVVTCSGGDAGNVCSGPITITSRVTTQGGSPLASAAAKHKRKTKKRKPKPKPKVTTQVTVGSGTYSVTTGQAATVKVTLDPAGQKVLNALYSLKATVAIGGTTPAQQTATFSYTRLRTPPAYTWAWGPRFTVPDLLGVVGVPNDGQVSVACRGGGCPFHTKHFKPKNGRVAITKSFKKAHLRPRATVEIEVTAPNRIGGVYTFLIRGGHPPTETFQCLPPGAHRPVKCR